MTNFHFLQNDFPELYALCTEAEEFTLRIPQYALQKMRISLEAFVQWMYENDSIPLPYDTNLSALMHQREFRSLIGERIFKEINLLRLFGNDAAHQTKIKPEKALEGIKYLHSFACLFYRFYGTEKVTYAPFNDTFLPDNEQEKTKDRELQKLRKQLEQQELAFKDSQETLKRQMAESEELRQQIEAQKAHVDSRKTERIHEGDLWPSIPLNVDEKTTRKEYIDVFLSEVGWKDFVKGRDTEFKVSGMTSKNNPSGIGYVDYVLWGDDGLPLAVIEAKKTMVDAAKGRQQAVQYADCLENEYKQRPLIFYSNGYETHLWDDLFYPPRQVSGFLTKESLQLLVDRRRTRQDLRAFKINEAIAGRPYQLEAVKRIAEHLVSDIKVPMENPSAYPMKFRGKNRKSLLVMATGSGKTRTSAAVIDMLTKCNWAKRILFLADRNALVSQAKKNIAEYLPHLVCEDITGSKESSNARIIFSTYHTIMHRIDAERADGNVHYSAGHFDAIIIDEAHRSVYQTFGHIFDYFDSLLIGLTATPKKDIDKNTYQLFELEDENPTFAYQLEEAVRDHYLVPPKAASVPLKFLRQGIKYKELSAREQEEYELKFGNPIEGVNDEIDSEALNRWLLNSDTIDKVLIHLMENGIRVSGGDKLGKTIIFAKNHVHAVHIETRFNVLFPEYGGHFLRVIDNQEPRAQDLLENFVEDKKELAPQIAVSVDMMDTGVDAPRVVNLVFFKPVKSYSKFWQMIGRGTRLRPDLFGPGEDKTHFLIFDFCENFEFFDEFPDGVVTGSGKTLSQRVFEAKLELAFQIQESPDATTSDRELEQKFKQHLYHEIASLDKKRFVVRNYLRYVEKFSDENKWNQLEASNISEIKSNLSFLPPVVDAEELAKRFDSILLRLMHLHIQKSNKFTDRADEVIEIAHKLERKSGIPQVMKQMELIKKIQLQQFWDTCTLSDLEKVRECLRDLLFALEKQALQLVYTSFTDELNTGEISWREPISMSNLGLESYKKRIESFVREHKNHLVIHKLYQNEPITAEELHKLEELLFQGELGTRQDYESHYGKEPLGKFIRSILGMDVTAANKAFSRFLQDGNLKAHQQKFIQTIIDFLNKNGFIDPAMLYDEPFNYMHDEGVAGLFPSEDVHEIYQIIDDLNRNAGVA